MESTIFLLIPTSTLNPTISRPEFYSSNRTIRTTRVTLGSSGMFTFSLRLSSVSVFLYTDIFSFGLSNVLLLSQVTTTESSPVLGSLLPQEIFDLFRSFIQEGISEVFICVGTVMCYSGHSLKTIFLDILLLEHNKIQWLKHHQTGSSVFLGVDKTRFSKLI